jgi:hypothetical protein
LRKTGSNGLSGKADFSYWQCYEGAARIVPAKRSRSSTG